MNEAHPQSRHPKLSCRTNFQLKAAHHPGDKPLVLIKKKGAVNSKYKRD
jgi:hypothetical protein